MPGIERMSESASWAWLVGLLAFHGAWWLASRLLARFARGLELQTELVGGRVVLSGLLDSEGDVFLGEPFTLRLASGMAVRVEAAPELRADTSLIEPWQRGGRLLARERLVVEGMLERQRVEAGVDDGYRTASADWTLSATHILSAHRADQSVLMGRRAQISTALALVGLASVVVGCGTFVILAIAGEHLEASIEVTAQHRDEVVPMRGGATRLAYVEEIATASVSDARGTWTFQERVTEAARGTSSGPVVVAELGGLRFGQMGREPGLSLLVPYLACVEALLAAFVLYTAWAARNRAWGGGWG